MQRQIGPHHAKTARRKRQLRKISANQTCLHIPHTGTHSLQHPLRSIQRCHARCGKTRLQLRQICPFPAPGIQNTLRVKTNPGKPLMHPACHLTAQKSRTGNTLRYSKAFSERSKINTASSLIRPSTKTRHEIRKRECDNTACP